MLLPSILISGIAAVASAQSFQYGTRFPENKLYNLSPDTIGLDRVDGTIAAFGDFNGDKYTDICILSSDQSSLSVYTWHHQNFTFLSPSASPQISIHDFVITNIIPGDLTYDGKLDLLVMGQKDPRNSPDGEVMMRLYKGDGNSAFDPNYIAVPSAKGSLPMVVDLNGDMKLDLLGYAWNGHDDLSMWINTADPTSANTSSIFNLTSAASIFDPNFTKKCTWANPHSNAVIDLDGDCRADLLFVCEQQGYQSLQMWIKEGADGYRISHQVDLPTGAGPLSFADMDGDGSIDIIFPVHDRSLQEIHIVYNQQIDLCAKSQSTNETGPACRRANELCIGDPNYAFDFSKPSSDSYVVFDLDPYLDPDEYVQTTDDAFKGSWPIPARPGDYNLDGYPDLLVTTSKEVLLLESILCRNDLCSAGATSRSKRTFRVVRKGVEALTNMNNARQATFFDIDEDGSLDILVLQLGSSSSTASRIPNFIINNFFNDAFFLKGLVSNGVCPSYCPNEPAFPDPKPYGVNYPGATLKFTVLDTAGNKRAHMVAQLSQSSYLPLQTPYCLIGLGRTNNYIEEMFAGVSRNQERNYLFYEGVIPNSQLIFIPYQPPDVEDSSSWKVELYVQPGDYVPWVLAVLIAAALILGGVVAVLYWMEKREDAMERRKALHIINFDAL